jgi:hypothetical protein
MKNQNLIYWAIVIILIGGCIWLFTTKTSQVETPKQNLQYTIDSLNSELSTQMIDNGRYEIILNRLWEADSNFVIEHTKYVE